MESDEYISEEIHELLNPSITDIGDGTIPMIPHRFKFCKPSVSNTRAREINKELRDRCHDYKAKSVLLFLKHELSSEVDFSSVAVNELFYELKHCYGLESVQLRQFQNIFNKVFPK